MADYWPSPFTTVKTANGRLYCGACLTRVCTWKLHTQSPATKLVFWRPPRPVQVRPAARPRRVSAAAPVDFHSDADAKRCKRRRQLHKVRLRLAAASGV